MKTSVILEDSELVLLDSRCRAEIQVCVDAAKFRLAMEESLAGVQVGLAHFVADVVTEAKTNKLLVHHYAKLRQCRVCGVNAGYYVFARSSRHHRAGTPDYDHPKYLSGVELADSCIVFTGNPHLGCCNECFQKALPLLASALKDVEAEIPESILGSPPRFKRYDKVKCKKCGWEGHKGEMRMLLTMMGDGRYPGGCPKCENEANLFNLTAFESLKGYSLVPTISLSLPEAQCQKTRI